MTNAFTDAERVLHDDPNLSEAADYRMQGRGPAVPLRVIRSVPSTDQVAFGMTIRAVSSVTISVPDADATPIKGDTFTIGDGTVLTVLDAKRNAEGTSWDVTVR